jgi:hypothetical protein
MNRCLSNKALYYLYAGDGNTAHQFHLDTCVSCAQRYEQFSQRLTALEQTLQQPPTRFYIREATTRSGYRYRLSLAAAIVAVVFLLMWGNIWQEEPIPVTTPQALSQEIARFLATEASPALFATADVTEFHPPRPVADTAYVEAALTDDWPCEQYGDGQRIECDIHPFPLLIEKY